VPSPQPRSSTSRPLTPSDWTSALPLSRMLAAIRVKSPFSHSACSGSLLRTPNDRQVLSLHDARPFGPLRAAWLQARLATRLPANDETCGSPCRRFRRRSIADGCRLGLAQRYGGRRCRSARSSVAARTPLDRNCKENDTPEFAQASQATRSVCANPLV
jgi:hypothetical protein